MNSLFSRIVLAVMLLAALPATAPAQRRQGQSSAVREVQGIVSDESGKPAPGAIVQLKNTKTLQIISFITRDNGDYYFHGLSPDIDFELQAEKSGKVSSTRTLSTFDTRRQSVLNLKLDRDKK